MKRSRFALLGVPLAFALAGPAWAKLPPPSDEAKAKAAEAAAKSAWSDKVGAYQTCQSQMHVAARYFAEMKQAGKEVGAPLQTPGCTDPGPFVAAAAERPPEAAGAHSPAASPAAPPSSKSTAAEIAGSAKK